MNVARPTVTVVVPTRDRPEGVRGCVDALTRRASWGTTTPSEIVVVDNSGRDAVVRLATDPAACVPVRVLREPLPGASRARNLGLATATTDIVVFVDDDIVVGDGWLSALVEPLLTPDVVATVGPIELEWAGECPRWLTPNLESWYSALDLGSETRPLGAHEHGWAANLAVRRRAGVDIGGFDTRLGPGTAAAFGDDVDFLDRLRARGGTVVFAGGARVRHVVGPERLRLRWLVRRAYRQGVTGVARDQLQRSDGPRRHPIGGLGAVGGAVVRGFPQMVRTARDPVRRPSLLVEQLAIRSVHLGTAAGRWSPRALGLAGTADGP